jgi:hypothetical protein
LRILDAKKLKKMKEKNLPKAVEIISRMNDAHSLNFKTKLKLQPAKVSNDELSHIGKMTLES